MTTKLWFITGATRGIASEIAKAALADGNQVVATGCKPEAVTGTLDLKREDQIKVSTLLPIIAVVFIAYLVIGLALPVLPLYVHEGLGLGTFVVGLVAGSQFAASLISRLFAGDHADSRGPKRAVVRRWPNIADCLTLLTRNGNHHEKEHETAEKEKSCH